MLSAEPTFRVFLDLNLVPARRQTVEFNPEAHCGGVRRLERQVLDLVKDAAEARGLRGRDSTSRARIL